MAEEDRRISLAGKVLVDKLDAQLLKVHKQGQVVGLGVALTMAGRLHRRMACPALRRGAAERLRRHGLGSPPSRL